MQIVSPTLNLNNVKLIFGNGFDLYCGLKSSYKDFFQFGNKFNDLSKIFSEFVQEWPYKISSNWLKIKSIQDRFSTDFSKANIWDFFFAAQAPLNHRMCELNWCDIESLMADSLSVIDQHSFWKDVYKQLYKPFNKNDRSDTLFFVSQILKERIEHSWGPEDFFKYLKNELSSFEKEFGNFISQQIAIYDYSFEVIKSKNTNFISNQYKVIKFFGNNLHSIDTFNYDPISSSVYGVPCRNINSTTKHPIFGIKPICGISSNSDEYILTKTYRHLEEAMDSNSSTFDDSFEHALVFGHSLNRNDYDYFFPILDKLKMYDISAKNKIIFAYYIYDQKAEKEIREKQLKSISELFESYGEYKGLGEPSTLLDQLTTFNRIRFCQMPDINLIPAPYIDKSIIDQIAVEVVSQ